MSVKIIAYLNPVKNNRTIIETSPGSIQDIIISLNTGFPVSQARVCRNGEIIKDFTLTAGDGDTLWIKFIPYGSTEDTGIGMKIGGWALVALGIAAFFIPALGSGVGVALIGSGIGMALGGHVLLNVNIPPLKDSEKPENDPSVRGGKNQARPLGRIPVLFGQHRIYPDLAANPHTSIIGNQQYLTQLFCGGYKNCEIDLDSFKLGDTELVKLSKTKDINQILSGADPVVQMEILQNGEESKLYPHCVHEDVINAPLQNEIDGGDGGKTSGEIIRTTPDKTDKINVDVFLLNGIGKYNDEGELKTHSISVKVSYKNADDDEYKLLQSFNISGSSLKTKRYQASIDNLRPAKYDVKIERVTKDSTNSKIVDAVHAGSIRSIKSVDDKGNPIRPIRFEKQKDLTIIALRVMATAKINNVIDSFNYIAVSKLPVHSPNGTGPLYWLNAVKTRNPASMLLYALRGEAAQQQVETDEIDWKSLEDFYAWCEEHDYTCNAYLSESVTIAELMRMIGGTSRADILRIDSKISVVQDIERPSPVQLFTPKNTIGYSITMFSADVPDEIALRYIDENAGYAHNEAKVYNTPDGNQPKESPDTIQKIDLWGITNEKQALRIGMYNYACLKNRPFLHTIEVDIEYLLCNKGDCVQYAGDIALTGSAQGRIKGVIWVDDVCVGIDTDEPAAMTEGKQYAVRIRLSDGTIILKEAVFNPGLRREKSITYYPADEGDDLFDPFVGDMYVAGEDNVYYEPHNMILFAEPLDANKAPKAGDIYAFGVRGYEVIELIITDIQPGQNFTAALTCVEHSPEIFGVDKPGFVLPDFINRITPVSGAVDSGVVNPVDWKHFALFHDSEDEPPRPGDDWQDQLWYQSQNFRSIWQSTKIAETIESGEWSLPVRIKSYRGTDDITPVWLGLTPQNITLETDGDGNVLAELFPLTVQARLLQWNSLLTGVLFSLPGDPQGVSVDSNGVITIEKNAKIDDYTEIIVNAEYLESVYTSAINIKKNIRNSSPRYLGTVSNLQITSPEVFIIKGRIQGQVRALQGDYVLAIAAVNNQSAGSVFQWTGAAWEFRPPSSHSDLYINCFKDGLEVPELTQNMGWFGNLFVGLLFSQKAFIEELQTMRIKLQNGGVIESVNFQTGVNGFRIEGATGDAEFNKFRARGDAFFDGDIRSGQIFSSNNKIGQDLPPKIFSANQTARDVHVYFNNVLGSRPISGKWNGRPVSNIVIRTYDAGIGFGTYKQYIIEVTLTDTTPATIITNYWIDYAGYRNTLGVTFEIQIAKSGAVFRLLNLPQGNSDFINSLPEGQVYLQGSELHIKI